MSRHASDPDFDQALRQADADPQSKDPERDSVRSDPNASSTDQAAADPASEAPSDHDPTDSADPIADGELVAAVDPAPAQAAAVAGEAASGDPADPASEASGTGRAPLLDLPGGAAGQTERGLNPATQPGANGLPSSGITGSAASSSDGRVAPPSTPPSTPPSPPPPLGASRDLTAAPLRAGEALSDPATAPLTAASAGFDGQGATAGQGEGGPSRHAMSQTPTPGASPAFAGGLLGAAQTGSGGPIPTGMTAVDPVALTPAQGIDPAAGAGDTQADDSAARINQARIARGLTSALNQQGGSLTLRLTPAEMGTVRIQVQMHAGTVSAQFHAQTPSAQTVLHQQMADLRAVLEGHGLTVDRLTVQPMSTGPAQTFSDDADDGADHEGHSRGEYSQSGQQQSGGNDPDDPSQSFEQWIDDSARTRAEDAALTGQGA